MLLRVQNYYLFIYYNHNILIFIDFDSKTNIKFYLTAAINTGIKLTRSSTCLYLLKKKIDEMLKKSMK